MFNKLLTLALVAISTEAIKLDALPLFDSELAQTDNFEGWEDMEFAQTDVELVPYGLDIPYGAEAFDLYPELYGLED